MLLYHNTPVFPNHTKDKRRFPMEKPNKDGMKKLNQDNDEKVINGTMPSEKVVEYIYSQPDPKPYD